MIIVSGPSTIGKNPLIYQICEKYDYHYQIPWTTRNMRKEERNGVDYFFIPQTEFQSKIKTNEMIHWDFCLGNYYGFCSFDLTRDNIITHGLSRMAIRIKHLYPSKIKTVFLMPKDKDMIIHRLTEIYTGEQLVNRIQLVNEEITHACLFDEILMVQTTSIELLNSASFMHILNDTK